MSKLDWVGYRLAGRLRRRLGQTGRISYSQCGEDMISRFVFDALKIAHPTYLDIGAHHTGGTLNRPLKYQWTLPVASASMAGLIDER